MACGTTRIKATEESSLSAKKSDLEQTKFSESIKTEKGTFTIPGNAFMDGIDEEALDGHLTVMNINIWDNVPRNKPVCSLRHGDEIQILESKFLESEERYYFKIAKGNCIGWVSEPFVNPIFREAKGDLIE